jgi:hypothetical protein
LSEGHTKIRNALFDDHLRKGWMDEGMVCAYLIMLRECDWSTGVWRGCAEKLVRAMGNAWSESTARRILRRLELGRYITRKNKQGFHGNYDVQINNYVPTAGPNKGKKLHRVKTVLWKDAGASASPMEVNSPSPVTDPQSPMTVKAITHDCESQSPVSGNQDVRTFQDAKPQESSHVGELVSEREVAPLASLATPPDPTPEEREAWTEMAVAMAEALGMAYLTDEYAPALRLLMDFQNSVRGLNPEGLKAMYQWTQRDKFWKTRVLSLDNFARFLARTDEKGMAAKYERHVHQEHEKKAAKRGNAYHGGDEDFTKYV